MERPVRYRFNVSQSLDILGLARPRIAGKTQEAVDAALAAWMDGELKHAYRTLAKKHHPDRAGDAQAFKDVADAYERLRKLTVRVSKPSKPKAPPRPPPTPPPPSACPLGHHRIPVKANFCHACGYAYPDLDLTARLQARGLTEATIQKIKMDGTFARLSYLGTASEELATEIELLFHRQRLGLFGAHANWRGWGER